MATTPRRQTRKTETGSEADKEPADQTNHRSRDGQQADQPKAADQIVYETRNPETVPFPVMGIRPRMNFASGRLEWEVPREDVERFARNHFAVTGRVVRRR